MLKALIAGGDLPERELLLALCKSKGYQVESGGNSGDVLQIIQHEHIDVCVLDVDLPGMNIVFLVSVMQELRKDVYIVILGDHLNDDQEAELRSKNIFYFVPKPLNWDEIERVLQAATKLIMENDDVIEEHAPIPDDRLFEVVEEAKNNQLSALPKDPGAKHKEEKRQREEKIKNVIAKVHEGIFKIDSSINRNILSVSSAVSEAAAKIPVRKTEILQNIFIEPLKAINNSINGVILKIANMIWQLK